MIVSLLWVEGVMQYSEIVIYFEDGPFIGNKGLHFQLQGYVNWQEFQLPGNATTTPINILSRCSGRDKLPLNSLVYSIW